MKVVARRPGQEIVADDDTPITPGANPKVRLRSTSTGKLGRPVSLQSALLRGYWEPVPPGEVARVAPAAPVKKPPFPPPDRVPYDDVDDD